VHDKPDDKLKLIKYDLSTRNQGGQQGDINVTLQSVGRVWSRSEGGKTGGATNRSHSRKKNSSEATGIKLEKSKAGRWPCFVFFARAALFKHNPSL